MDIVVVFNHKSALTLQSQFFTNHGPPKIENTFFAGNEFLNPGSQDFHLNMNDCRALDHSAEPLGNSQTIFLG